MSHFAEHIRIENPIKGRNHFLPTFSYNQKVKSQSLKNTLYIEKKNNIKIK